MMKENHFWKKDILLAPYTTFKIGGPASYFKEIKEKQELEMALREIQKNNLPYFVLGAGSNILISDQGFKGAILKMNNTSYQISPKTGEVEVEAGAKLSKILGETVKNNLTGLEWSAGIPGTMGGAIYVNCGAFNKQMSDYVKQVLVYQFLDSQWRWQIYNQESCHFDYRGSIFQKSDDIIWQVGLILTAGKKEKSMEEMKNYLTQRKIKQPLNYPTAGCIFKNVLIEEYPELIKKIPNAPVIEGKIPAGWFIEQYGLKKFQIGQAMISEQHANFIINLGGARAQDVLGLIKVCQEKIFEKFGVKLELEIQLVGF